MEAKYRAFGDMIIVYALNIGSFLLRTVLICNLRRQFPDSKETVVRPPDISVNEVSVGHV